jgi:sugar lactone lactonase YvrE
MYPHAIAIDTARNRAVVVDIILAALIGVDLETGDRTVITQRGGAGSGDDFSGPLDIEVDMVNDRAFVTDQYLDAVFSVDLSSGARAILSGNTVGTGDPLRSPKRIAFEPINNRIVVTNVSRAGAENLLAHIDPDTGNRDFRTITGTSSQLNAMAFDPGSGLLYFTGVAPDTVHVYDYESSAAVIVSQ